MELAVKGGVVPVNGGVGRLATGVIRPVFRVFAAFDGRVEEIMVNLVS